MSDLIDRQQTLNALTDAVKSVGILDADDIKTVFDALPSVQPEKTQLSQQGATSDTISRQAAIDALKEHRVLYCDDTPETFSKLSYVEKSRVDELDTAISTLVNLPSVQLEPHEGHWKKDETDDCPPVFRQFRICSVCGAIETSETNYCPNCGAKMKGAEHETN